MWASAVEQLVGLILERLSLTVTLLSEAPTRLGKVCLTSGQRQNPFAYTPGALGTLLHQIAHLFKRESLNLLR